jgi:hypothetical protein
MAGFITLSQDLSWSSANWVYWGFLDHVLNNLCEFPEAARMVEQCKWMQNMTFRFLEEDDPVSAGRVRNVLRKTAHEVTQGKHACQVDGRTLDDESQRQFVEAISRLLAMMDSEVGDNPFN